MKHIKNLLAETIKNESKAKFYSYNQSAFLRHFDNEQQYKALILAGKFEKMEQIIKENSTFKFDEFEAETKSKMESK
jgi:hypothetical protein